MQHKLSKEEAFEIYCVNGFNATVLAPLMGINARNARKAMQKMRDEKGLIPASLLDPEDMIDGIPNELAAELEKGNIPHETVKDGNLADLWIKTGKKRGFSARFKFTKPKETPEFPLIQPARDPIQITYDAQAPYILHKVKRAAIISDMQAGHLQDEFGSDITIHDPLAIDVAKQIVHEFAPHKLGYIGDALDLSMFSRWPKNATMVRQTQKSINTGRAIFIGFKAAAGPQLEEEWLVLGNHDDRLQNFVRDVNVEGMELRRADDTSGWPVFSLQYLLGLDTLGVKVTDSYPRGLWWITSNLVAGHAPIKKLELQASYIHGHMHKITVDTWAQTSSEGRFNYFMYDIGCLCKTDGTVPSNHARNEWAQGIGLVEYIDGKIPKHQMYQVKIENGEAMFMGDAYVARPDHALAA